MNWLLSLSAFNRVMLGLGLGIFTGLFFGELVSGLDILGEAYIRLLQMTVIPYIIVSLIGGLGRLNADIAKRIGIAGGLLVLLIWGITEISNLFLALAYPNWTTASLFSTSLLESAKPFDPLTLYIPSNPFYSMANAVVPAVVVFSIMLGVSLISIRDKGTLLTSLGTLSDALMKIASFVGKLAPFGIFAISAAAAGTLKVEELSRLQIYLWAYLGAWTVLTFWTLPAIVAWSTPLTYRQVLRESRVPMITAFATGTVLVVLPMIAERCKRLLEENDLEGPETDSVIDVMVPTAYSFPSAGTLLGLGFIMFSAWYVGSPISVADYASYVGVGAFVAFGSMAVAIPFMLDFFSLPADMFQLYLLGSVVTARFATALAAMHGIVISLLVAFAVMGRLRVRTLFQIVAVSIGIAGSVSLGMGFVLTNVINFEYSGEQTLVTKSLITEPVRVKQFKSLSALPAIDASSGRLSAITARGTLRVAYMPDRLPFAYRNSAGIAVGYDIDLAQRLAESLGVTLELVRISWPEIVTGLNEGRLDLAVGGIAITPTRAQEITFSNTYFDHSVGFVLPDHMRDSFAKLETIQALPGQEILVPKDRHYMEFAENNFPLATLIPVDSHRAFFKGEYENAVLLASAEAGSAWTLLYPEYGVAIPNGLSVKAPAAIALPDGDSDYVSYINTWLLLTEKNGFIDQLYNYWILGEEYQPGEPRWSIMRNVLGLSM
ncbi:MAG: cation:dicarboxylase symporter family transporter [Gammaproteobacteria bacterium]|nr:cation:dicarboxylase symporter family transporter [Gammaproteobacteria bacterium]MDH3933604.1 cation:dicarboxylase symporter family transporter [Gammaproteobacteria bacterium]MDH3985508.1 cation:dicarboxylase symporter family transporter [Gammaproteobacteria bacterium]